MDWPYRYNPHIWPLLATTAFLWLLGLYSWRRRSVPGALYFVLVGFSAGMWAIFATLQLLSSDLTARFFWWRLQLWIQGVPSISVFFFVVAYAGLGRWLTRRNLALIATPPLAAAALLIYTNNLHRWMWTEVIEGEYLGAIYAPGFWSLFAYVYLLYLVETGILIWLFVRSPLHRWPVAVILAGQLFIRIVHSLDAAGQGPRWPYDPVILAFNVAAICYALALFRFRIFDVLPLARQTVIERMDDGVVVMDAMGRIADLNPAAQALLAAPRSEMIGREARQALKRYPLLRQLLDDPGMMQTEIQIGADSRWYEAHLSPLLHARGFHLGKLLLLHDETEQKQARVAQLEQERLSAAESERQRVGRDLHDDLSQELAFINLQAQAASELLAAGQSHQAGAYLGRLAEVSREAQAKVRKQITGAMVTFAPEQGFAGVLGREVEQFGQKHGLRMEINIKNDGPTQALEPAVEVQLFHIIQEALANVYKHACASNVRVSLVANPAEVTVIVEDDGVGFDAAKLARGDRTFGLRIMAERAAEIGAAFQVASEPGQGTRVIVCIRNPKVHR